ncbi:hypothetical protein HY837_00515 [archaeon]|nr:hypothetical protein [archaeon]
MVKLRDLVGRGAFVFASGKDLLELELLLEILEEDPALKDRLKSMGIDQEVLVKGVQQKAYATQESTEEDRYKEMIGRMDPETYANFVMTQAQRALKGCLQIMNLMQNTIRIKMIAGTTNMMKYKQEEIQASIFEQIIGGG